jgi:3-hydroxyisobutyrate dehydrogenase-like beta-hydroxyacid dehydrogenase
VPVTVIGILHPGEMGAAVGAALTARGHEVWWASDGRSEATAARAAQAGLRDAGDVAALAERCAVLLSICPPHAAREVAAAVAGFRGLYVDANAVSPRTAAEVAVITAGDAVDGGIVGPPPQQAGTTRLYLSGARAGEVKALFDGTRVDARVLSSEPGSTAASALKVAYAAWTKGTAALLIAIGELADGAGVRAALAEEWSLSQPDLQQRVERAAAAAAAKGWRWAGEMRESAEAFGDAGLPPGFSQGAAEIYERG